MKLIDRDQENRLLGVVGGEAGVECKGMITIEVSEGPYRFDYFLKDSQGEMHFIKSF